MNKTSLSKEVYEQLLNPTPVFVITSYQIYHPNLQREVTSNANYQRT